MTVIGISKVLVIGPIIIRKPFDKAPRLTERGFIIFLIIYLADIAQIID